MVRSSPLDLAFAPWEGSSPWGSDATWRPHLALFAAVCFCTVQAVRRSAGRISDPSRVCAAPSAAKLGAGSDLARALHDEEASCGFADAEQVTVFALHSAREHNLAMHVKADLSRVPFADFDAVAARAPGRWLLLTSRSTQTAHMTTAAMECRTIEKRLQTVGARTGDEALVGSEVAFAAAAAAAGSLAGPSVSAEAVVGTAGEGLASTADSVLAAEAAASDMAAGRAVRTEWAPGGRRRAGRGAGRSRSTGEWRREYGMSGAVAATGIQVVLAHSVLPDIRAHSLLGTA
jgi:hypothetical protein